MPPDVGVVVAAAGRGERCGGGQVPKQYRPLAGVPLLLHALRPFLAHPAVGTVVVALPPADSAHPPLWLADLLGERLLAVAGGASRMDSVAAGLRVLPQSCSIVLVHDGARPFPETTVIDTVIDHARQGRGAVAGMPVADTLKEAAPAHQKGLPTITRTVPRATLWRAQTPQGFPRAMLEAAYFRAGNDGVPATDDAELVERIGATVVLIHDVSSNLKVTTAEDFLLAEALAASRR